MAVGRAVCPQCGRSDTVRKVSAIVADGTTMADVRGIGVTLDGGELVGMMGGANTRSVLAARLAPPRKPLKPRGDGCVGLLLITRLGLAAAGLGMLTACAACSFPTLYASYRASPILVVIVFSFFAAVALVLVSWVITLLWRNTRRTCAEHADYPYQLRQWQLASEYWEQLYYCYRDDGVFLSRGNTTYSNRTEKVALFTHRN